MVFLGFQQERAGRNFAESFVKKHCFLCFYVEFLANTMCLVGFRHERARVHFVVFFARDY